MQHLISLQEAIDMTSAYRTNIPKGMVHSETFSKESVIALLNQTGCKSLRIYYGKKNDDTIHAILVGVNEKEEDMIQSADIILEDAGRCPPFCPTLPSPLNG